MSIKGVAEWTPQEYNLKQSHQLSAPRRFMTVVRSQVDDGITLTDADLSADSLFNFYTDALNATLALLHFPTSLRPFLDCLIGVAGDCGDAVFTATNYEVGKRARSGKNTCSDDSMERWVSRQKRKFDDWQGLKMFELVKIKNGDYDFKTGKNLPTSYTVSVCEHLPKIVALAQSKFYWRTGAKYRRFQGRAIREAARDYLYSLPECPPLQLKPPKDLSEQEKFDRRYRTILTHLEKNRDALAKLGIAHEDLFIYLVNDLAKLCFNPPGIIGNLLIPDKNEPDRLSSVWNKIKRGEGRLVATESLTAYLNLLNAEIAAVAEVKDGVTNLSTPKNESGDLEVQRLTDANKIAENWFAEARKKIPDISLGKQFTGSWSICWQSRTTRAFETAENLERAKDQYAKGIIGKTELAQAVFDYLACRLQYWRGGVPFPHNGEVAHKLFDFL